MNRILFILLLGVISLKGQDLEINDPGCPIYIPYLTNSNGDTLWATDVDTCLVFQDIIEGYNRHYPKEVYTWFDSDPDSEAIIDITKCYNYERIKFINDSISNLPLYPKGHPYHGKEGKSEYGEYKSNE